MEAGGKYSKEEIDAAVAKLADTLREKYKREMGDRCLSAGCPNRVCCANVVNIKGRHYGK